MNVKVLAPAKINLGLEILKKRSDGYHEVDMIMQSVNLCDEVALSCNSSKEINVICDKIIPCSPCENIAYKAAKIFFKETKIENPGIDISIKKQIPIGAGLAGGSSDAGAVLIALNKVFNAKLSKLALMSLGGKLGSDVPFCIMRGCAHATGIGMNLHSLKCIPNCDIVVVKPNFSVLTGSAYELSDSIKNRDVKKWDMLIEALTNGDLEVLSQNLFNRFEEVLPDDRIKKLKRELLAHGALGSLMTGSGSAVFGIFDDRNKALLCSDAMRAAHTQTFVCHPMASDECDLK